MTQILARDFLRQYIISGRQKRYELLKGVRMLTKLCYNVSRQGVGNYI